MHLQGCAALRKIMALAQVSGLLSGRPAVLAEHFAGLLWRDLMVSLPLGVTERPNPAKSRDVPAPPPPSSNFIRYRRKVRLNRRASEWLNFQTQRHVAVCFD
jgi:hypothetical protein